MSSLDQLPADFSAIQKRTNIEAAAQIKNASNRASRFSLRELINHQLEWKMFAVNQSAVSAAYEQSDVCRQLSGEAAWGCWVPFSALARDLTVANTPNATTGIIGNKLQPALEPYSAVMGGATVLSGLKGNQYSLPVIGSSGDATAAWVAEGANGISLQPTTKVEVLTPKQILFYINVSRTLMMSSSSDLENDLREEILRQTMRAIDAAALNGAGGNAPTGLMNNAGLQVLSAGANGLAPNWSHLVEAEYQVSSRVGAMRNSAFITSPAIRKKLRMTQRAAGLDFIVSSDANSVMGQPLRTSSQVPDNLTKGTSVGVCSPLIFGDISEVVVGFWGPLAVDIMVDRVTAAKDGKIRLTCRAEVGVAVRNIGAFAAYKDLLSA
jgi:HK97 family phage major capsid protein